MTIKQDANVDSLTGTNFSVVHSGPFAQLDSYTLKHPRTDRLVKGKLFIKDLLGLTGMQISMNKLPAGVSVPFYHQHKENEEAYIFVGGRGQMQVDGKVFDVQEGSIVRIATAGSRCLRNNSDKDLYYICVQAKENSLNIDTFEDGIAGQTTVTWPA